MYHSPVYLAPFLNLYIPWNTHNTVIIASFHGLWERHERSSVFDELDDLSASLAALISSLVSVSLRQDRFSLSMSLSGFIPVSLILLQHATTVNSPSVQPLTSVTDSNSPPESLALHQTLQCQRLTWWTRDYWTEKRQQHQSSGFVPSETVYRYHSNRHTLSNFRATTTRHITVALF